MPERHLDIETLELASGPAPAGRGMTDHPTTQATQDTPEVVAAKRAALLDAAIEFEALGGKLMAEHVRAHADRLYPVSEAGAGTTASVARASTLLARRRPMPKPTVDLVAALRNGADALDVEASQDRKPQRAHETRNDAAALRALADAVEAWRGVFASPHHNVRVAALDRLLDLLRGRDRLEVRP